MSGYNKATSDPRGLFTRFLPPTWRNTDSSNVVHNTIIKSIATTLVTTESDLLDSRAESYLDTASGVFLDKWGSFSGVIRRENETDDQYRARIKRWFTKKKGTVNSLIDNIKEEFEGIDVYIYEPWRNIFYTNKSVLNGVDRLQGFYYRFAVIDIHISSTVDVKSLAKLVDRYKDAGVVVYFTYETGLSITTDVYDITMNASRFTYTESDDSLVGRKKTLFPLGQPRDGITDADLFKTNDSKINGKDVLSGNPFRGKVTYNSAGAAIVAKKYTTDMQMADAMVGVEEYDSTIYGSSNNADGITYTIENAESTIHFRELLDAVLSSITFSFSPTFSYTYDTSNVSRELKYYVDVILNNTTFSYNSSTRTISRITAQITSESPVVYNMLNSVASNLNVYVDNVGNVQSSVTVQDNPLLNKYEDFCKMYILTIDPLTGDLNYTKNTSATLTALSKDEQDEIYRITKFKLSDDGVLAYTTTDSSLTDVNTIVNAASFLIDNSGMLVAKTPNLELVNSSINSASSKLNVYDDSVGNAQSSITTYDSMIVNKYEDFCKMYTLSIDPLTRKLSYTKNVSATLTALSKAEQDEIYRITKFKLSDGGVLAYTTTDTSLSDIKAIVNSTSFLINNSGMLVAKTPSLELVDNISYTISRDTFFIFDWLSFIKQNETGLFLDNMARYIRFSTRGSQYGFNMRRVEITTETGVDVSDDAKWTIIGDTSVNLANGTIMSYPNESTRSYVLDLGQVNKLASIKLTDNYLDNVKRVIEVSTDGITYHKVGQVYSRGGDTVDVNSFSNIQDIGTWINNHTTYNKLAYSLRDIITSTDISLFDFSSGEWGNSTILPKGDVKGTVNINSSQNISKKGLSVVRITSTKTPYRLDMLKFNTGWL